MGRIKLRQRVLVGVDDRNLTTTILGEPVSLPFALAPIGLGGMQFANGEILACRAAQAAGIPYTLSTMSICSIKDVAAAVGKPFWFQVYVMKDRGFARSLIERAAAAKCGALVLTVDLPVLGQRHADVRNGLSIPPSLKLGSLLNMLGKPAWGLRMLAGRRWDFGNLRGRLANVQNIAEVADWVKHQFDPSLSWKDVEWIRSIWKGPLIIKGILDVEDARIAAQSGAAGIVVSNHGGRQLDGAPATVRLLPEIVEAVGTEIEVLFDGGIRSGQDVFRALALGARACLIGRAYVAGLGAGGQAGVARAIAIIANELDVTMALAGKRKIAEIDASALVN
jgi:L-lactate dehydrogenase (cytochrome)